MISRVYAWGASKVFLLAVVGAALNVMVSTGAARAPAPKLQEDLTAWIAIGEPPIPTGSVMVFFSPPLQIDSIAPDDSALQALSDSVPLASPNFSPSGRRVSEVYQEILANHASETLNLSETQRSSLRSAECTLLKHHCGCRAETERGLREPSQQLLRYQALTGRIAKLRTELMTTSDKDSRDKLANSISLADDQLTRCNLRIRVETALAKFNAIQALDPEIFWSDLGRKLALNSRQVEGWMVPQTRFDPPINQWLTGSGWSDWHFGSSAGSIKIVFIERDWLDIDALIAHPWKWSSGMLRAENVIISDGRGLKPPGSGDELMPLVSTYMLLGKDVVSDGVSLGLGPTIIGFVCRIVPPMPVIDSKRPTVPSRWREP